MGAELYFYITLFHKFGIFDCDEKHYHTHIWSTSYNCCYKGIGFDMIYDEDYDDVTFSVARKPHIMDTGKIKQSYSIKTHKHSIIAFQLDRVLSFSIYIENNREMCYNNDGDYYRLYDMNYFEEQADIVELDGARCVKGLFGEHYESSYRIHNTDRITRELQKDVDGYVKTAANFAYSKYLSEVHKQVMEIVREICG